MFVRFRHYVAPCAACLAALFSSIPSTHGAEGPEKGPRTAIGKLASGSLFRREAPGKPWQVVPLDEDVFSGDLLLSTPTAIIATKSGVHLELLSDLERRSPFPVIETAVVLHDNPKVDLSFTLDRGRIALSNHKSEGKAVVEPHFGGQECQVQMHRPGCRVAFELYGRFPKGKIFSTKAGDKDSPTLDLVALVLAGEATFDVGDRHYLLKPPPGPALLQWDSETGWDHRPSMVEKRPTWGDPAGDPTKTPEGRKRAERFQRLVKLTKEKSIEEALVTFLHSDDVEERRLAVYGLAALDDLEPIGDAVMQTKHEDVWDNAVLALRHWLGRKPGQDKLLYQFLVEKRKYSHAHAAIMVQLLHSFGDHDLACPECYELLIAYLKHEKQAIRGLAQWHLRRLVPAGREIKVDPTAPLEDWDKAYKAWKKIIPDGKMPAAITKEPTAPSGTKEPSKP